MPYAMRQSQFLTAPSGLMLPRGAESVMLFNGLKLNDRRILEQFRVTRVTGMGDAELRDDREPNPDGDGETPFTARYGGRTITLQGYLEAGNIEMLRYMWYQLKRAFDDISGEKPLALFGGKEFLETWEAAALSANVADWTMMSGNASHWSVPGDGTLTPLAPDSEMRLRMLRRSVKDFSVTIKLTPKTSFSLSPVWLTYGFGAMIDANNYLWGGISSSQGLVIGYRSGGVDTIGTNDALSNSLISEAANGGWIRFIRDGTLLRVEYWTTDPLLGGFPRTEMQYALAGGVLTQFGNVTGNMGMAVRAHHVDWRWNEAYFGEYPGDPMLLVRKAAAMEGDDEQSDFRVRRPFLITLRSSSDVMYSKTHGWLAGNIALATLTFPGGGTGIPFPTTGGIIFGAQLGTATNKGFAPTYPILNLTPPATNVSIVNLTNGTRIVLDGAIPTDGLLIDCAKRTIVTPNGVNQYSMLGTGNTWLRLDPGANVIATGADDSPSNAICFMRWRHAIR